MDADPPDCETSGDWPEDLAVEQLRPCNHPMSDNCRMCLGCCEVAIREAVAAERDRCAAQIERDWPESDMVPANLHAALIAAAIRARADHVYSTKPPIGVPPRWVWDEWWDAIGRPPAALADRRVAVAAAVGRYRAAGLTPKWEWLDELGEADTPTVVGG
jgi:hypothetical protein